MSTALSSSSAAGPALAPLPPEEFGYYEAQHLLQRAGFGGTPDQVRLLADWGPEKSVAHLVHYEDAPAQPVREDAFRADIRVPLSPEERIRYRRALAAQDEETVAAFRRFEQEQQAADRRQIRNVQRWWLQRMIETPRPFEEKMTLFYHGHFATSYRTIENSWHLFCQNQMFRRYANGNFADLCFNIIRDPAMLAYLDNNESTRDAPNENLARELMELFTLGEGEGYTESDIKEGARALTGYSFYYNDFIFNEQQHDDGQKRIFGKSGRFNGDDFVKMILGRTQCSVFLCSKLYRYFVNDVPGGFTREAVAVVNDMARLLRAEKYNVAAPLEALFRSRHFYDAANRNARIKSPTQLVVQAVRMYQPPVRDLNILLDALDLMGQSLFFPPSVKGWEGGRAWINTSTLFTRQNILVHLLTGRMPAGYSAASGEYGFDALRLLAHLAEAGPLELEPTIEYLLKMHFGPEPSTPRRDTLMAFAQQHSGRVSNDLVVGLLSLITAMPEYQLA